MFFLYVLRNKSNDMLYVGQTNNIKVRMRKHKTDFTKNRPINNAIKSYGWNNFEMRIIEIWYNQKDIDDAETFWIKNLNTRNRKIGYNLAKGGRTNRGWKHTKSAKNKQSAKRTKYFETHKPWNTKLSIEEVKNIRQLFISEQMSVRELSKKYDINRGSISKILHNKAYKDISYSMTNEQFKHITKQLCAKNRSRKEIIDGFGNIFDCMQDAAKYYNVTGDTIRYRIYHPNLVNNGKNTKDLPQFSFKDESKLDITKMSNKTNAKLSIDEEEAKEIKKLYATNKYSQRALANRFNTNQTTISLITRDKYKFK